MRKAGKNARLLKEYSDRMVKGDHDAVYDYFAEDFFSHVAARVNPEAVGRDIRPSERLFWENCKKAFPDGKFTINLVIESDDIVVCNWSVRGTHTGGNYYDVPPSGRKVEINGTGIVRFKDGKIVEHWGGPHCMHGIGLCAGHSDLAS